MKKKINRMLVLIATLAIFSTVILTTVIYYDLFRHQVMDDLRAYTILSQDAFSLDKVNEMGAQMDAQGIRITLIDNDGQVVYDNEADKEMMSNHLERPEIAQALASGEGQSVRRSETLSRNTFYYAVRLEDGGVLRLSRNVGSIYSVFGRAMPVTILILGLLLIVCMILARFQTAKLIQPIGNLAKNLDGNIDWKGYEELSPFMEMIHKQHDDIMKNAMMRQEFTANVSHELKTPLTSISGYAELIETGMASSEDVIRFAHGIHNSASRLLTLINDIIRLSELDGTNEEVIFERLNLYQMADTCVEMLQLNAEKHEVSISIEGCDCMVNANRQMMEEVLYNLCDNAIRYNNAGGSVKVDVHADESGTILTVSDTGIGISKEHQERIFERFYRVDKSRSKSTGGTGLGLAIVKHIIALHHASMELQSEAGKGTTITVVFPQAPLQ